MHQSPTGKALPPSGSNPIATAPAATASGGSRTMAAVSDDGSRDTSCLDRVSHAVHSGMETAFAGVARAVVARPVTTIAAVVLLTAALAQGIHRFEEDTTNLFVPRSSRAVEEETYVEATFGKQPLTMTTYFAADTTGNMLTADGIRLLSEYHTAVVHNVTGTHQGETVTFTSVCETGNTEGAAGTATVPPPSLSACRKALSPLTLWDNAPPVTLGDLTDAAVLEAVNSEQRWRAFAPNGANVTFYLSPEGLVRDEATGAIVAAKAVRMLMWLTAGVGDDGDERSQSFERGVLDYVLDELQPAARAKGYSVEVQTHAEQRDASNSSMNNDFGVLASGYLLMIAYACFVLARARPMYSHISVALASVGSVGMSTLSAYGFCWLIGLKFNPVVQVLVLVLLGIGIDDTFVIMDSWWDEAHIPDMKERMVTAMRHAGPAITITSVTDLIAFLCGATTVLPALRDFCYYASLGIFFDFAFQCTFFVAITFIDSRRQDRGKADCCVCIDVEDDRGRFGTVPPASNGKPFKEGARPLVAKLIGEKLPVLVLGNPIGKAVVLLVAATFIGIGIWGLTDLRMNFNVEWFVPSDSDVQRSLDVRDHHFKGLYMPVSVYAGTLEDNYPKYQEHLETYTRSFEKGEWVVDGSATSWLREFVDWVGETEPASVTTLASGIKIVAESRFYPLLRRYTTFGVGPKSAMSHARNLRWNDEEVKDYLKASKINFMVKNGPSEDGQTAVDAMDSLRESVEYSNPKLIAFTHAFIFWEGYRIMLREMLRNVIMAGAAVFVLVSLLLANIQMGAYIVLSIAAVDTCLLGFMPIIGVEVNSVSVICIVIAVGLAVDYSVHIGGAFLKIDAQCNGYHSPNTQRAAHALWKMGPAVVNGGFSTFLAVLPLCVAKSYVFKVFFRMFCLIILFGQFFGVFVVPVLLSFVGPAPVMGATHLSCAPWTSPLDPLFKHEDPASPTSQAATPSPKQLPQVPVIETEMRNVAAYEPPAGLARGEKPDAEYRTTSATAPNIQVI
eukprot:Rhum_TRINITY_DN15113_c0_g1::Rhum_TRINITY_DN15113_c0_g1_i3::g.140632::m.140632